VKCYDTEVGHEEKSVGCGLDSTGSGRVLRRAVLNSALELRVSQKAWNYVMVWTTLSQALLHGINKGIFVFLPVRSTGIPSPPTSPSPPFRRRRGGKKAGSKSSTLLCQNHYRTPEQPQKFQVSYYQQFNINFVPDFFNTGLQDL